MSAPHSLEYDVVFNGNKISSFDLDVDLDNPVALLKNDCYDSFHQMI